MTKGTRRSIIVRFSARLTYEPGGKSGPYIMEIWGQSQLNEPPDILEWSYHATPTAALRDLSRLAARLRFEPTTRPAPVESGKPRCLIPGGPDSLKTRRPGRRLRLPETGRPESDHLSTRRDQTKNRSGRSVPKGSPDSVEIWRRGYHLWETLWSKYAEIGIEASGPYPAGPNRQKK